MIRIPTAVAAPPVKTARTLDVLVTRISPGVQGCGGRANSYPERGQGTRTAPPRRADPTLPLGEPCDLPASGSALRAGELQEGGVPEASSQPGGRRARGDEAPSPVHARAGAMKEKQYLTSAGQCCSSPYAGGEAVVMPGSHEACHGRTGDGFAARQANEKPAG